MKKADTKVAPSAFSNNNSSADNIPTTSAATSSTPSQLFVHDLSLYKELIESISVPEDYYDDEEQCECLQQQRDSSSSVQSEPKSTCKNTGPLNKIITREEKQKLELKREAKKQETEAYFQKIKETTTKLRNKKHEESEKRFQELWNDILEERETFLKDLNEKLAAYHEGDERKRQQIYEEWCEKVFDPIQNQIDDHLSKLPFEEIKRKKRLKFEEYLNKLNHKHKNNGGVFRDIVLEDEYDPFELSKDTFKYKTTLKKKIGEMPPKPSMGLRKQDMLDVVQYDKLDATPFGHYSKMIHPNSNSSKLASKKMKSDVEFDDFTKEEKSPWENVRGKKILQKIEQKTTQQLANGFQEESGRKQAKRTTIPGAKK